MSYQSDEEQVELLKRLWKEYGKPAVIGVMITLVAVFGYKAWQKNQYETAVAASQLYQNLLETVGEASGMTLTEEQHSTVNHVVVTLQKDYSNTLYAAFATLFRAQQQVRDNQLDAARLSLDWVVKHNADNEAGFVARIRLARVLLAQSTDNVQAALDVLKPMENKEVFAASREDVSGDVYLAMGQKEKAAAAYQKAINIATENGESRPLLQLKLDDLAPAEKASQEG
ncbi:hypothetical protein CI610_01291 [invertebrate metagenome]|uniref:Ancillary SecYEG translocon subunit n=1 Tax=invertebrate metagenome TaxID=1711999 RepID=A0A2H9T950_9ZZZZ